MDGRASKMAITRSSRVEMCGNPDHLIRNSALFDFVGEQSLLEMHIAPGARDLLPFWAVFSLKIFQINFVPNRPWVRNLVEKGIARASEDFFVFICAQNQESF